MAVVPAYERNMGFFSEQEQKKLGEAVVAIAGVGGDGGELAVSLARLGVGAQGGEIRLADPDPFEVENLNRQAGCTTDTIGVNKAEAIGRLIQEINSEIKVVTYKNGVIAENIDEFLAGADLLADESEFTRHVLGVMIARAARRHGVPNLQVMNVGFGAQVTTYDAAGKFTLEKRLGLREDMPLEEIEQQRVPITRWLAEIPRYADLKVFEEVARGKSAPSVVTGVNIAGGIASAQAVLHLLGSDNNRPRPVYAPHVLSIDAMTGQAHLIKNPRVRIAVSMAEMLLRNKLGWNPRADYS